MAEALVALLVISQNHALLTATLPTKYVHLDRIGSYLGPAIGLPSAWKLRWRQQIAVIGGGDVKLAVAPSTLHVRTLSDERLKSTNTRMSIISTSINIEKLLRCHTNLSTFAC